MKINMLLSGLNHSGGVQVALSYLNYFVQKGASVVCYVPMRALLKKGITNDSLGRWFDNKFEIRFVPFVNNMTVRSADITIATAWKTSYWLKNLSAKKGKKVYFIQGYETWFSKSKNKKVRESYHFKMDLRISVSTALQKKLLDKEDCKTFVICNGIQENFILEEFQKNHMGLCIGMPYREEKIKNCNFGMKVVEDIVKDNPNLQFKMYGFKKPNNLKKDISFLQNPKRSDLAEWYDSIDIFYVPSLYEGWGLPAMEAMARGCAVIASNTGCMYEFGKNNINCLTLKSMKNSLI